MSETDVVEKASKSIESILQKLNVQKIVCVDDIYENNPTIEDVLSASKGMHIDAIRKVFPEIGETSIDDPEMRASILRRIWQGLTDSNKIERAKALIPESEREQKDRDYASMLSKLIPAGMLMTLSPGGWDEKKKDLLKEAPGKNTLFLFDQIMSKEGGGQTGIMIIAALLAKTPAPVCGLLSHQITPENQFSEWERLSRTYTIDRDKFMVLPKRYLQSDPGIFAQILKFTALSPDFASLKKMASEIMNGAAAAAAKSIEEINIFNLDHIVFRVSADEGLWEPDMLFRLHALFHRFEARRAAQEREELRSVAQRLRSVSNIPTESRMLPPPNTRDLQRKELYEDGDYLNRGHLPIDLGDIFQRVGTKKFFILLAQPCDLMVRKTGHRHPELEMLALIPISRLEERKDLCEELQYFGTDEPMERWFCLLKYVDYIPACVLDLCVFQSDGHAAIPIEGFAPESIRPTWQARFGKIQEYYKGMAKKIELLKPLEKDGKEVRNLKNATIAELLRGGPFKGELVEEEGHKIVRFNCKRVLRLSRSHAYGLLMAFTSCMSRPAQEADFGKSRVETHEVK